MYSLAEIGLARKSKGVEQRARWQRAVDSARSGLAQAPAMKWRKHLRVAELLADELLAGREPTMDIFYLAGLGELAASVQPKADIARVLESSARRAARAA